jgi:hypothetical protein
MGKNSKRHGGDPALRSARIPRIMQMTVLCLIFLGARQCCSYAPFKLYECVRLAVITAMRESFRLGQYEVLTVNREFGADERRMHMRDAVEKEYYRSD